jgi:hypothetical protein
MYIEDDRNNIIHIYYRLAQEIIQNTVYSSKFNRFITQLNSNNRLLHNIKSIINENGQYNNKTHSQFKMIIKLEKSINMKSHEQVLILFKKKDTNYLLMNGFLHNNYIMNSYR